MSRRSCRDSSKCRKRRLRSKRHGVRLRLLFDLHQIRSPSGDLVVDVVVHAIGAATLQALSACASLHSVLPLRISRLLCRPRIRLGSGFRASARPIGRRKCSKARNGSKAFTSRVFICTVTNLCKRHCPVGRGQRGCRNSCFHVECHCEQSTQQFGNTPRVKDADR